MVNTDAIAAHHNSADPDHAEVIHQSIQALKLGLADLYEHMADVEHMRINPKDLLTHEYLTLRAKSITADAQDPRHGGTVYLCAADESGMMVSFIQSNYMGFGSGVVMLGTGISLQNRGAAFSVDPEHANVVAPGKRPFKTIIPGFAMTEKGEPLIAFGLMGGPMQAQGHFQMMLRILRHRQNPQAATDAPRWRVEKGRKITVEKRFPTETFRSLEAKGHIVEVDEGKRGSFAFGGAQIIINTPDGYIGSSDHRKDGQVVAY